ncbi:MAG: UDP-N-acetylglucosamine--N-acetylmuramyl-(pentapeptide) pyrophosphoryl-undecaprenol N-acetylglucosamine transferase [Candidatus Omnitrophota bacterium]|nr:UDP-N-acetylglucosamine--N-acetylmuramyl-(pentapeptide) pyrophosphoryl-undecaprenol N-acetylglucosamine transferase [Candidatus Omnitrophota bacterium]
MQEVRCKKHNVRSGNKTLLVCERSGGHVFPAVALGEQLRKHQKDVYFFVTAASLKSYLQEKEFKVYGRSFSYRNIVFESIWRAVEAVWILLAIRPKQVIGFGGRDSFFLVLFSAIVRLDTAIYEPNIIFGRANKVLSFFVRKVLCGFSSIEVSRYKGSRGGENKVKVVGIPLRDNIKIINKDEARKALGFDAKPVILCFGGSQGASFINKSFIAFIEASKLDYNIIHLTGKRDYFQISQLYNKIDKKAFVKDFYYSMETLYSVADLVICRSGASTLGEIAYYKLPSILIPYPSGGRHQRKNAYYFSQRQAAYVFLQENFSFDEFKQTVERLIQDRQLRKTVKDNLGKIRLGVKARDFYNDIWS